MIDRFFEIENNRTLAALSLMPQGRVCVPNLFTGTSGSDDPRSSDKSLRSASGAMRRGTSPSFMALGMVAPTAS